MQALDPQPGGDAARLGLAPFGAAEELGRRLGRLRLGQRWLGRCFGARVGAWLARANGLGFSLMALYLARPLPEARGAILRLALVNLSWCAGLAALSLAGTGSEKGLREGRGLLENRGVSPERTRAERPAVLTLWTVQTLGLPTLLVVAACLAAAPDALHAAHALGLALGSLAYLGALGLGLGLLATLCQRLGAARGQSLLLGIVILPELIAPAWPELPTVISAYAQVLDVCLGLGLPS